MSKGREWFKIYERFLNRRPYLAQSLQTGTLMGTGDLISQTIVEKKSVKNVDLMRTLRFSSIGFLVSGPGLRLWYGILQKRLGTSKKTDVKQKTFLVALKKVFFDQCVFAPIFLFFFLIGIGIVQGKTQDAIEKDVKTNYIDILKTNYCIWPFVQILNFYYIPLQYQVLLVQVVAVFWNTYLSWKTMKNFSSKKKT